jgi:rhodanese-related sulfurtransferase
MRPKPRKNVRKPGPMGLGKRERATPEQRISPNSSDRISSCSNERSCSGEPNRSAMMTSEMSSISARPERVQLKEIGIRLLCVVTLSLALGAIVNATNPNGIHFGHHQSAFTEHTEKSREGALHGTLPMSDEQRQDVSQAADVGDRGLVTWNEVKPFLNRKAVVLIDAQPANAFKSNHLRGATSLPGDSSLEAVEKFERDYMFGSSIIVHAGDGDLAAAVRLARKLKERGYRFVRIMSNSVESIFTPAPLLTNVLAQTQATNVRSSPIPISWGEAKTMLVAKGVVLIDSRPRAFYEAGHIPGAISLPVESTSQEFAAFRSAHNTDLTLIVYCSSANCSRSEFLANKLIHEHGYTSVRFMTGGYLEWQQEVTAENLKTMK